jgi:hypothetical protein
MALIKFLVDPDGSLLLVEPGGGALLVDSGVSLFARHVVPVPARTAVAQAHALNRRIKVPRRPGPVKVSGL